MFQHKGYRNAKFRDVETEGEDESG